VANDIDAVKTALIADIESIDEFNTVYRTLRSSQDIKDSKSAAVFLLKAEIIDENSGEKMLELKYGIQIFIKSTVQKNTNDDNESEVVEKFLDIVETGFTNLAQLSEHINIGELIPMDDDSMGVGFFLATINYKLT